MTTKGRPYYGVGSYNPLGLPMHYGYEFMSAAYRSTDEWIQWAKFYQPKEENIMTTNGAAYHLARVNAAYDNPNSPTEMVCLESLEYLLGIRAEAEQAAQEFVDRAKAKTKSTDAIALGNAIHQDFADMLQRVKLAQEFALELEKDQVEPTTPRIGTRFLEILGRPVK